MKTKYTLQEAKDANEQYEKLEAALKNACAKLAAIVGDKRHQNGHAMDAVKITAPYRVVNAEVEAIKQMMVKFNKAAGKHMFKAMAYARNPGRYPECIKYIKEN